jgi:sec-independent protein translocase protein TatA
LTPTNAPLIKRAALTGRAQTPTGDHPGLHMPNIGPTELVIVLVLALLILGPKRLPAAGRSIGQGMREFKTSLTGVKAEADDPIEGP